MKRMLYLTIFITALLALYCAYLFYKTGYNGQEGLLGRLISSIFIFTGTLYVSTAKIKRDNRNIKQGILIEKNNITLQSINNNVNMIILKINKVNVLNGKLLSDKIIDIIN